MKRRELIQATGAALAALGLPESAPLMRAPASR